MRRLWFKIEGYIWKYTKPIYVIKERKINEPGRLVIFNQYHYENKTGRFSFLNISISPLYAPNPYQINVTFLGIGIRYTYWRKMK